MKKYALITLIFGLILLMTLFSGVHAQNYNWNHNICVHLHVGGQSLEWSEFDEVAGCGIGAYYDSGTQQYTSEYLTFRRSLGYAMETWVAMSDFCCYMWMGSSYNYWPYIYTNQGHPNWDYAYFYVSPNGQYYHYQQYNRTEEWSTSEIYVMADQWFYSPLLDGYGIWECYGYVHAPVGGGDPDFGGTWL
jgi:hypothetical protein